MLERTIENLQLEGGCAVFDFTNTINNRRAPVFDYLNNYEDLLTWSNKAGLLSSSRVKVLSQYAGQNAGKSKEAFLRAKQIREVLYQLFSSIGENKTPDPETVNEFNRILSGCFGKLQLQITSNQATPNFVDEQLLDEPVCNVVKSAYDILTGENFARLKECPNCGWLFVDRTKNGKRRWCDMNVCGSRDKAKRYYHRKKDEATS